MNFADIFNLKYGNIDGDFIRFYRQKTIRTQRKKSSIEVYVTPEIKEIIDKHGNSDKNPDRYIFSNITNDMTAEEKHLKKKQFIRHTNYNMKKLKERLGITANLNTYVARHSYATMLKHAGVSISLISESLGHGDEKTTREYLDSFPDETKKETANTLRKMLR